MHDYLLKFNRQDVIFALKGVEQTDFSNPTRTPDKLRNLFLANTDNKILSGAVNSSIMPATLFTTRLNQRGFCLGRQFCLNFVEPDAFQRVYDCIANSSTLNSGFEAAEVPVLALFDICNAFPSIAHVWLFAVLRCLKLSSEIVNIILHLYSNCAAYSCGIGTGELLFDVLAGVRTGCPLSANLFLLGFNPFVFLINYLSDGPKVSRTCICADDVGSCLKALKHFKKQYMIWKIASKVAGLVLKPTKCFLVVTCVPLTPVVKQAIANWLSIQIPAWKNMRNS